MLSRIQKCSILFSVGLHLVLQSAASSVSEVVSDPMGARVISWKNEGGRVQVAVLPDRAESRDDVSVFSEDCPDHVVPVGFTSYGHRSFKKADVPLLRSSHAVRVTMRDHLVRYLLKRAPVKQYVYTSSAPIVAMHADQGQERIVVQDVNDRYVLLDPSRLSVRHIDVSKVKKDDQQPDDVIAVYAGHVSGANVGLQLAKSFADNESSAFCDHLEGFQLYDCQKYLTLTLASVEGTPKAALLTKKLAAFVIASGFDAFGRRQDKVRLFNVAQHLDAIRLCKELDFTRFKDNQYKAILGLFAGGIDPTNLGEARAVLASISAKLPVFLYATGIPGHTRKLGHSSRCDIL